MTLQPTGDEIVTVIRYRILSLRTLGTLLAFLDLIGFRLFFFDNEILPVHLFRTYRCV